MSDAMLTELYKRAFETKAQAGAIPHAGNGVDDDLFDRRRQVALEKNQLLSELINIRTEQIRNGDT